MASVVPARFKKAFQKAVTASTPPEFKILQLLHVYDRIGEGVVRLGDRVASFGLTTILLQRMTGPRPSL